MVSNAEAFSKDPRSAASKAQDLIPRGTYGTDPLGLTAFLILRSLDPFLQFSILAHGLGTPLLHSVGLRTLGPGGLPVSSTGIAFLDNLGLSPTRLIILGMALGSTLKNNICALTTYAEPMDVKRAVIISIFNTVFNSLNSYLYLITAASTSTEPFPTRTLIVGTSLYLIGIITEYTAELQRRRFKDNPANKGKPYTGGLWSLARHINYGAYTVWRAGYAILTGGWIFGAVIGAFFFADFANRAVPVLNEYCEIRYGKDWEQFKKQTRSRLFPGIY